MSNRSDQERGEEQLSFEELEATPDELRLARALGDALDGAAGGEAETAALVAVVDRVRASSGLARPLSEEERDVLIDEAVEQTLQRPRSRWPSRIIPIAVAAALVVCALGLIWLYQGPDSDGASITASRLEGQVAPTDTLFDGPFPEDQSATERVDRIVSARTRGYFAALISERQGRATSTASIVPRAGQP